MAAQQRRGQQFRQFLGQRLGDGKLLGHAAATRASIPPGSGRARRPLGRPGLPPHLADSLSGSTHSSGAATLSYGYSTSSVFTQGSGWTTTGSSSGTCSGWTSSSFSASSPFERYYGTSGEGASLSGSVSGDGSDWTSYSYSETKTLNASGLWVAASGSGGASGGSTADWSYWSYSGSDGSASGGSYWDTGGGGSFSGTLAESGSESFSQGYSTGATLVSGEWSQTGSADTTAAADFSYAYSGYGSGSTPESYWGLPTGTAWSLDEHGSGAARTPIPTSRHS